MVAVDAGVMTADNKAPTSAYPTSAFDYDLPDDRIARFPHQQRDESRLLALDREKGEIEHRTFRDLVDLIPPGDALVINETRVFPARLLGRRQGGGGAEILILHPVEGAVVGGGLAASASTDQPRGPELWEAIVRPGSKLKPGRVVAIAEDLQVEIVDITPDGTRLVRLLTPLAVEDAIQRYGRIPLPPYIDRDPDPEDAERYQTVYARELGSVAAPTAGLHFTEALIGALQERGVRIARVLLHVGVGTFRPVEVDDPTEHRMHSERFLVTPDAAATLNDVRHKGGKLWAVGTTVARTLESVADESGTIHPGDGWTDLFIRPPYHFRAVDRLITNFHLPRSTLLMLVAALAGYDLTMRAYREAIASGYRFYSYGDAMLVL